MKKSELQKNASETIIPFSVSQLTEKLAALPIQPSKLSTHKIIHLLKITHTHKQNHQVKRQNNCRKAVHLIKSHHRRRQNSVAKKKVPKIMHLLEPVVTPKTARFIKLSSRLGHQ